MISKLAYKSGVFQCMESLPRKKKKRMFGTRNRRKKMLKKLKWHTELMSLPENNSKSYMDFLEVMTEKLYSSCGIPIEFLRPSKPIWEE